MSNLSPEQKIWISCLLYFREILIFSSEVIWHFWQWDENQNTSWDSAIFNNLHFLNIDFFHFFVFFVIVSHFKRNFTYKSFCELLGNKKLVAKNTFLSAIQTRWNHLTLTKEQYKKRTCEEKQNKFLPD